MTTRRKTSTVEDIPLESQTPQVEESLADAAYKLAGQVKVELDTLKASVDNPQWIKEFLNSQHSLQRIVKIILWLFFCILTLLIIAFLLFSVFEFNNLLNILEYIRESKKMEINSELLSSFNQLFFHIESINNFFASVLGTLGILGFFTFIFIKVSEKFVDSVKSKE